MARAAGRARALVRFERKAALPQGDGAGNYEGDWQPLIAARRVELTPTRPRPGGGETVIAARAQGLAAFDLWVRLDAAVAGVTTDDRVVDVTDPARAFNIRFIGDMDGKRQWLLMQLELGGAT
jgi:hypothetical protein